MSLSLSDVLAAIYDCEENASLSSDWDDGWRVRIGGSQHTTFEAEAYLKGPIEAAQWLHEQAVQRYPEYRRRYSDRAVVDRSSL